MKLYITYEEPFANRKFNSNQIKEVYRDMADKAEYPSFEKCIYISGHRREIQLSEIIQV